MLNIEIFKKFQAKAGCVHSQRNATKYWRVVEPYLTEEDARRIKVEWSHVVIGMGREGLDIVCDEVFRKHIK